MFVAVVILFVEIVGMGEIFPENNIPIVTRDSGDWFIMF